MEIKTQFDKLRKGVIIAELKNARRSIDFIERILTEQYLGGSKEEILQGENKELVCEKCEKKAKGVIDNLCPSCYAELHPQ